jgi:two-component system OmpR family response regulator
MPEPDATLSTKANGAKIRALVVDDEAALSELLSMALRYEGWEVQTASNGLEALTAVRNFEPDVMVLDIMMPELDGMSVLRRLREEGLDVPVLFLSAKDGLEDRISGLTAGGDDYVTKPFSLEEVVARLRALVRRTVSQLGTANEPIIRVGDLVLNEESYEVTRNGAEIELTSTEFELLRFLMRNPKRVVSKSQILDRVWSYDFSGKETVVELYISYLRKKIDTNREPMIHTVRGAGYMLKAAADAT